MAKNYYAILGVSPTAWATALLFYSSNAGSIIKVMSRLIGFLHRCSKLFIFGFGIVFVGLMGLVDYATGPELLPGLFYLLPVFIVTWFAGRRFGYVISIVCAAVWFFNDAITTSYHTHTTVPYGNVLLESSLFLIFTMVLSALKNAEEHEKAEIQNRIQHDLSVAQEVQSGMFPRYLPPMAKLEYAGECKPALGIAGDYYDFLPLGDRRLGIAMGDVAGKGLPAALLMASLQGILRSETMGRDQHIETIVANLNRLMSLLTKAPMYATLFYGQYDDSSQALTFVNAGHNPPLLLRGCSAAGNEAFPASESHNCRMERLTEGGTVLGIFADSAYQSGVVRLEPGDLLVLYTDGITEAANSNEEEFGEQRLAAVLAEHRDLPAAALLACIFDELACFMRGVQPKDDMTLAVLRIL
jgi:serine phosphatase RsbU (regulator of sigma subunit)